MNALLWMVAAMLAYINAELVDLTHYLEKDTPKLPVFTNMRFENEYRGPWNDVDPSIWVEVEDLNMPVHYGTHVDAPSHFKKRGLTMAEVPLERFVSPAVVVDFQERVRMNPNEELSVRDLLKWESEHGRIPDKAIVLAKSGWSYYFREPDHFYGVRNPGMHNMSYPGISAKAAQWLIDNRNVYAVGSESLSIDQGNTTKFPSHVIFAANDVLMIENVGTGLHRLPARGAVVMTVPLKIRGGSGSPVRMMAVYGESVNLFHDLLSCADARSSCSFHLLLLLVFVLIIS